VPQSPLVQQLVTINWHCWRERKSAGFNCRRSKGAGQTDGHLLGWLLTSTSAFHSWGARARSFIAISSATFRRLALLLDNNTDYKSRGVQQIVAIKLRPQQQSKSARLKWT